MVGVGGGYWDLVRLSTIPAKLYSVSTLLENFIAKAGRVESRGLDGGPELHPFSLGRACMVLNQDIVV